MDISESKYGFLERKKRKKKRKRERERENRD